VLVDWHQEEEQNSIFQQVVVADRVRPLFLICLLQSRELWEEQAGAVATCQVERGVRLVPDLRQSLGILAAAV
jgi:hypothetical protein